MRVSLVSKILFFIVCCIVSAVHPCGMVLANDETVNISTFYPSPKGIYDRIDVVNAGGISGSALIGNTLKMINTDPAGTVVDGPGTDIDKDGNIKSKAFAFLGQKYYTPTLRARSLTVTQNSQWRIPSWQVEVGALDWGVVLASLAFSIDQTAECPNGLVNSITNLSGISPFCLGVPVSLSPPVAIVLCVGQEKFILGYSCLNLYAQN